jgi:hypothetical protein
MDDIGLDPDLLKPGLENQGDIIGLGVSVGLIVAQVILTQAWATQPARSK